MERRITAMIILRHKNYSTRLTKTLYGWGKTKNSIDKLANLGVSDMVLKREAITKSQAIRKGAKTVKEAITKRGKIKELASDGSGAIKNVIQNPGKASGDFVGTVAKRPLMASGAVPVPGTTEAGLIGDTVIREVPIAGRLYERGAKELSKAYERGGRAKVEKTVNNIFGKK